MADRVGQRLGNYQLVRLLGEGGFAEVYLGEHVHLYTQAAIKVLYTQLTYEERAHGGATWSRLLSAGCPQPVLTHDQFGQFLQ